MSLLSLPPELLNEVTTHILSYDLANLYMCGAKSLNRRLLDRGVTVFRHEALVSRNWAWPSLLGVFPRLEEVYISDPLEDPIVRFKSVNFDLLPRALRVLHLDFRDDYKLFAEFIDECGEGVNRFPQIKVVDISGQGETTRLPLPMFPTLEVWHIWEDHCPGGLPSFAPMLKILAIKLLPNDSSSHLLSPLELPETLTTCKISQRSSAISLADFARFPAGLTCLDLRVALDFGMDTSVLPRGLKTLRLTVSSSVTITDAFLTNLPPELRKLDLGYHVSVKQEQIALLPRSLRKVGYLLPSPIGENYLRDLPPSLTDIGDSVRPEYLEFLPNLRTVKVKHSPNFTDTRKLSDILASMRHMTYLELDNLPPDISGRLPPSLTSLRLSQGVISQDVFATLPRGLKSLVTVHKQPLTDDTPLQSLPPAIETLDLIVIYSSQPPFELRSEGPFLLPSTITYLTLGPIRNLTNEWFAALPTSLTSMKLKTNTLPPEALALIPSKSLHSMQLRLEAEMKRSFFAAVLKNAPRFLTDLNVTYSISSLPKSLLFDSDFADAPKHLEQLSLPSCEDLTVEATKFMPNLRSFMLADSTPAWFTRPESD